MEREGGGFFCFKLCVSVSVSLKVTVCPMYFNKLFKNNFKFSIAVYWDTGIFSA